MAVTADGNHWVLLNASPDLTGQLGRTPSLHPNMGGRGSPISAVLLTCGEIDALAGLLSLREGHAFAVYGAPGVLDVLDANPIFNALPPGRVPRRAVAMDEAVELAGPDGAKLGLRATAFAVPGKVPLFAETGSDPGRDESGVTVGLQITAGDASLFFIPGCAAMTSDLRERLRGARTVLFDGTLWRDDEMIRAGLGTKTGGRMGHMSISGPLGVMAEFAGLGVEQKIFVHLNNTNPALLACSPERAELQANGWEVATDGMELSL
jgi:pyrroloquinoline quinone biosynthesis protein B